MAALAHEEPSMPPRQYVDHARIRELLRQGIHPRRIAERTGASTGSVHRVKKLIEQEKKK